MKSEFPLNSLGLTHRVMARCIQPGDFCIDATAGKGRDTLFLCRLVGDEGRVLALDIQPEAVTQTEALLRAEGVSHIGRVVQDCHSHLGDYAEPESVDGIMFNFGWLPGGDHRVFSQADTSVAAVQAALPLLRPGGVMSLCIYHGRDNGTAERDALLAFLSTVDNRRYTVMVTEFANRTGDIPIPVFIVKE